MLTSILLVFCFWGETPGYGAPISEDSPLVTIDSLMANPEAYLGKVVKVEGKVEAVCPMAGCWMDLSQNGGKVRIKVKDGEIVFDQALTGKTVIAEGTVYKFDLDRDQAVSYFRHLAEEEGSAFDPDSVTEGTTIYQIGGLGARLAQAETEGKP